MVRLADLPEYERHHLLEKNMPPLGPLPWSNNTKPLAEKRIALITTAGLHFRGDDAFDFADPTFRAISIDDDANDLIMSHSSANFDRSGFVEDVNLVFPINRFQELLADKKNCLQTKPSARWLTYITALWVRASCPKSTKRMQCR